MTAKCAICKGVGYYKCNNVICGTINVFQPVLEQYYTCIHSIDMIATVDSLSNGNHSYDYHIYKNMITQSITQNTDYKIIQYQSEICIMYRIRYPMQAGVNWKTIDSYTILTPVNNQQQEDKIKCQQNQNQINKLKKKIKQLDNKCYNQHEQLIEKERIIMARTNLNKRLIDTLLIYKHKQPDGPVYDYKEIKARKQILHSEFKRLSKLMRLG